MKTSEFLAQLKQLSIKVWSEQGELKVTAPKGVMTADLRDELIARKGEILEVLKGASAPVDANAPIAPIDAPETERPLSFTQQRLWFLQRLDPELTAYNIPMSWTLRGPLRADLLERAVREIARRHQVLRTSFPSEGGRAYPQVSPAERVTLERIERPDDGSSDKAWRAQVVALLQSKAAEPFDLAQFGLLRPVLVELGPKEHVLFCLVHHAVFDGWSIARFLDELRALYAAFAEDQPSPLGELAVQYGDFAAWQRSALTGAAYERELGFWRETLAGELPVLELPFDRPRPPVQTFHGAKASRALAPELIDGLGQLAGREGASLFMVTLAAYKALLSRYTGLEDVIVASPIAGRERPELADMIGFFANTLVLRTDTSGDPSFKTLLARVRSACLGAFEHQAMPFERLVDELAPKRNLSYTPLFQTLFLIEEGVGLRETMGPVEVTPFELETSVARSDLMLYLYREKADGSERWSVWAEYNTDLFDAATIEALLGHYVRLLEQVAADPEVHLGRLELLSDEERVQLLEGWNPEPVSFPEQAIHSQFERRADETPEALAVVFPGADEVEDARVTYGELDRHANRMAHHLIERGVKPGELVGLCLERSVNMLVGMLAIAKCGAAYVPLDPAFPRERLAYMIADSGLGLVVTTAELEELSGAVETVCVDTERGALLEQPAERPELGAPVGDRERLYVIYTSGSTGKPKGVELEHRSVSNFLASMTREPGFGPGDSILAVTTLSFDIAVLELLLPLVAGGTVIIAPREAAMSGPELLRLLGRFKPTAMQATPATWRMLLLSGWSGDEQLRVFCGGEALPRDLADELGERCAELWNLYGPTETTIWSTAALIDPEGETVPIGQPIGNTRAYILDDRLRPLPAGATGELWIGGEGLARGYLGRPELTAERFVEDPFEPAGGGRSGDAVPRAADPDAEPGRMYRTGDLARWRRDGVLECLGRADHQVKLRGFRIELGEIEAVLGEEPGIEACAAIVREDTPGDQRLVAYLQGAAETDALRARAREFLPGYMVPQGYVCLEALPLTPNGKIDRRALHGLAPEASSPEGEFVAPKNDLERRIAEVWGRALRTERVATDANFFDLGGHSLLLTEVQVGLQESLETDVSIVEMFTYPTVSALAAHLERGRASGDSAGGDGAEPERRRKRSRKLTGGLRAMRQRRGTRE